VRGVHATDKRKGGGIPGCLGHRIRCAAQVISVVTYMQSDRWAAVSFRPDQQPSLKTQSNTVPDGRCVGQVGIQIDSQRVVARILTTENAGLGADNSVAQKMRNPRTKRVERWLELGCMTDSVNDIGVVRYPCCALKVVLNRPYLTTHHLARIDSNVDGRGIWSTVGLGNGVVFLWHEIKGLKPVKI
jgi:hypothetical protein